MNKELGFSYVILNDSYAVNCAALALGAPLLIPFALKYGRRPVYILSCAIQFGVGIWSAYQRTVADLMMINILSGFFGALAEVIVQMTIADVFFVNQRGTMNSLFFWSTRVGAQLAPLAAGYSTVSQGWRWVWWWIVIFLGALLVAMIFGYEETKFIPPILFGVPTAEEETTTNDGEPKTLEKISFTKNPNNAGNELTATSIDPSIPRKTYKQRLALSTSSPGSLLSFFRHVYQPFQILFGVPGVFYMALVYGGMMISANILATTVGNYMPRAPYNFSASGIGMMSLAPFTGSTLGTLLCGPLSDWSILRLAERNRGIYEPEMRLWVMAAFAPFVPLGMIIFGVGLSKGWSWPIIAVGWGMCTFGTAPAGTIALTYIADAYTEVSHLPKSFELNAKLCLARLWVTPWLVSHLHATCARQCSSLHCRPGSPKLDCKVSTLQSVFFLPLFSWAVEFSLHLEGGSGSGSGTPIGVFQRGSLNNGWCNRAGISNVPVICASKVCLNILSCPI